MNTPRVVMINDTSTSQGGAAVLALMAARGLVARGRDVAWVTGDDGQTADLAALGVPVTALGERPLVELPAKKAIPTGLHNGRAAAMVRDFVAREDRPDTVYHVHAWAHIFSPALFTALRPVARRTVIHAHDMFLACPNSVFMDYQKNEVCTRNPLSLSCITTHCDKRSYAQKLWRVGRQAAVWRNIGDLHDWGGIIAIHPAMSPRIGRAGFPEGRIFTVRNPVVPYSEARIPAEDNRGLLYVGRLEEDKGAGDLAAAAARVGVPLTLVGDGALRAEIEARYPQVDVTGWLDQSQIRAYAKQARALVMPSRHPEPFALVIPEAISSGLPVLVAETALMAEEVRAAGVGMTFNAFDPDSIDGALRQITQMADAEVAQMSQRGHGGEQGFGLSPEDWITALEAQYDRVLSEA